MQEKLEKLYKECLQELEKIGINIQNNSSIGQVQIAISKRNNKRYGVCKQQDPNESTKYIQKIGRRKIIKYEKYNKHLIEISPWVMELNDSIIKNTIMHELIHCLPNCNDHGKTFKKYAKYINASLGYDIARVGNKEQDYQKSNVEYNEKRQYKYKIECKNCKQTFYRQRCSRNFTRKYRCGKCGGKFVVTEITK